MSQLKAKTSKSATTSTSKAKLPAHWDNTLSDLTEMKASPAEIARRRSSHISKNQLAAKIELQRRALNSVVKSAKKPLPAVFVREVLPKPESICSEMSDMSPSVLAMCADRILQKSARLVAPSVCSMTSNPEYREVNPIITKATNNSVHDGNSLNESWGKSSSPDNDARALSDQDLPVQVTPMVKTRLDRLAEATMASKALNEPSLLATIERQTRCNSTASNASKPEPTKPAFEEPPKSAVKKSRLPEAVAALEQLFSALQAEAIECDLLSEDCGEDGGSTSTGGSSHATLSGHTALLVRVLLGLVTRVKQLEKQVIGLQNKLDTAPSSASASQVAAVNEKVAICEQRIANFQEELRLTSTATTESLQRIRSELEHICINGTEQHQQEVSTPPSINQSSTSKNGNQLPINLPPVMDHELDQDEDDLHFGEFDGEPWLEKPVAQTNSDTRNKENEENAQELIDQASAGLSPTPSSIHYCPSLSGRLNGTGNLNALINSADNDRKAATGNTSSATSSLFGDRLGTQLAELTRQHEQARARLQAMQRSVNTMGRFVKP